MDRPDEHLDPRLVAKIKETIAQLPPLTPEQLDALADAQLQARTPR